MTLTQSDLTQIQGLIVSVLEPFAVKVTEEISGLKADIQGLREELKTDIDGVRTEHNEFKFEILNELYNFRQEFRAHVQRNQREHEEFRVDLRQLARTHHEDTMAVFSDHQALEKRVRKLEQREA